MIQSALAQNHGSTLRYLLTELCRHAISFRSTAASVVRIGGLVPVRAKSSIRNFVGSMGVLPHSFASIVKPCYFDRLLMTKAYFQVGFGHACAF